MPINCASTEDELKVIRKYYSKLRDFTKKEETLQQSHSINEVHHLHDIKNEIEQELKIQNKKNEILRIKNSLV